MKKQKLILFMSALLVVFLSVILVSLLFWEPESLEEIPQQESLVQELFSLSEEEINTLEIENPLEKFTLVNCGEGFAVEGIEEIKTSSVAVNSLTGILKEFQIYREIPSGKEKLAEYGLESPKYQLQITKTNGEKMQISLGNKAPDHQGVYLLYQDKVYLTDDALLENLSKGSYSFLDHEITPPEIQYNEAEIILSGKARKVPISLKITTEEKPVVEQGVQSSAIKRYELVTPIEQEINADKALQLTESVFSLYANAIEMINPSPDDLLSIGLDEPYSTVSVSADGENLFTLKATAPDENNYVYLIKEDAQLVYLVSANRLKWLTMQVEELRESIYQAPELEEISGFRIEARGSDYEFQLEGEDELKVSCQAVPVELSRFQEFYDIVTTIAPEQMLFDKPEFEEALTMTVTYKDGRRDILKMMPTGDGRVGISLNGEIRYAVSQNIVYHILDNCRFLMEGGKLTPYR